MTAEEESVRGRPCGDLCFFAPAALSDEGVSPILNRLRASPALAPIALL